MIKSIKEIKECPECGSDNISYNEKKQQVVCKTCGLIFEPLAPDAEKKFEKASGLKK
jgi:transcription initiation factor TFIIIB Brf1 subunit/transcription initiation factor TFIIB